MAKGKNKSRTAKPSTAPTAVEEPIQDAAELSEQLELDAIETDPEAPPIETDWRLWAENDGVGFFDLMKKIPETAWESDLLVYLYRLFPEISNREGDKKYIGKFSHSIDEDFVKGKHGGGKFHAILKQGTETLKQTKFWIEGEPILMEGQTLRGGQATAAPAASGGSGELAGVVRELIQVVRGDPKAADAGIRVMEKAMTEGLALNNKIIEANMKSPTGNAIGDQIVGVLIPRLLEQPKPDPLTNELVKAAIELLKRKNDPAPAPTVSANPMEQFNAQFSFIKELTGVENLRDLFHQGEGGGGRAQPFWVTLALNAIEKAPVLFAQYAEMQERGFQRALIAAQVRAGLPVPTAAPGATAPPSPVAVPAGSVEQQAQQAIAMIVQGICRAWDEGYPGDVAGAHLKLLQPELVEQFKPLLADPVQLQQFIAGIPELAARSQEEDWAEFQADLVAELNVMPTPAPAEPPPAAVAASVGGGQPAVPTPGPAPGKKKPKANGKGEPSPVASIR